MPGSPGVSDGRAQIMAHHVHFRDAILYSQLPDVLTDGYHIEALERLIRKTETAQVRRDDAVTGFSQRRHDQAPLVPVLRKTVQQHNGRPMTAGDIMNAHAVVHDRNVMAE